MKNISLDLVRVTEAAAIAASHWVGSGNKELADKAATNAMRDRLNGIDFLAQIAIGEGEKDRSYGLFCGECLGLRKSGSDYCSDAEYEIAVDPIEGTTPTVTSGPEAISTIAMAEVGSMFRTPHFYMKKLAFGKKIKSNLKHPVRLGHDPLPDIVRHIAIAANKKLADLMVCVLNRPRHDQFIKQLRELGVRIKLIQDCDVSGAIATCLPNSGVDMYYGIGGSPEAVLAAAAIKCMGGEFQAQVALQEDHWKPDGDVYGVEQLIKRECVFAATGITDGSMLRGVRFTSVGPVTHSVFMRSESGTVRWIETYHGN
jgi:fructose-1,6-bisphosphatase class II